jgi:signal transduction histidine kinase/ActR/RegA family two-component response regulator
MMRNAPRSRPAERVLIFAWHGRDAQLTAEFLRGDGIVASVCHDADALCNAMSEGADMAILTEEALTAAAVTRITDCLSRQPPWSDFPFVIFTAPRSADAGTDDRWEMLGNVALLERPVRVRAMTGAVRAALRARRRQYDARRAIQARDQFLAMLGHELRNPLAAVRLALAMLGRTSDPADVARHRAVIERQALLLSRLIDDLLDVARVTYGKVSLRPEILSLDEILRACAQSLEPSFRMSGLTLRLAIEPDVPVRGDRIRLEQVFSNLLSNAIKYTLRGGEVELSLRVEQGLAVVRVTDSGIGLDADMVQRVFDLFAQVDQSLDRAKGGLGIGLTLVRSLVQLHGGNVRAKSAGLGRGSEFCVELPLAARLCEPHDAPCPTSSAPAEGRSPARVVLVEDGADIRDLLKEWLEMEGHAVFTAEDGPTGVERILEVQPDIAFVDIGLPDLDGYEVAKQVRANGSKAVLVALTGYGQVDDRRRAGQAGFDRHMTKPVDLAELQGTLVALSAARRAHSAGRTVGA